MNVILDKQLNYNFQKGYLYFVISNNETFPKKILNYNSFDRINVIYVDVSIFLSKNISLKSLLSFYDFDESEIDKIYNKYNLETDVKTFNICAKTRALLLIEIMLKKSDIIMFVTAGLSYETIKICLQFLYETIRNTPKIGIVFEFVDKEILLIEEITQSIINNYKEWRTQL